MIGKCVSHFLLLGLALTSCTSSEIADTSPTIFEQYYVRFLQTEQQIKATASFFEGDSLATANPKTFFGGVSFLGSGMEAKTLPNNIARYTTTRNRITYPERFRFGYKNDTGELQDFNVELEPIDDFFLQDSILLNQDVLVTVNGGQLASDEQLVFLFNDSKNRATSISFDGPRESIEYSLSAPQLQSLNMGKGEFYLVKKKLYREEIGIRKIEANVEFYSLSKPIEVYQ